MTPKKKTPQEKTESTSTTPADQIQAPEKSTLPVKQSLDPFTKEGWSAMTPAARSAYIEKAGAEKIARVKEQGRKWLESPEGQQVMAERKREREKQKAVIAAREKDAADKAELQRLLLEKLKREDQGAAPPAESKNKKASWNLPGLPERLRKLAAMLEKAGEPCAPYTINSELKEYPSQIIRNYKNSKKWGRWVNKHLGKNKEGAYYLKP